MKFLLCLSLSLIALFAEGKGCFVDENSQNIIFVKDGETKSLGLKEKIYKDQRCAFDESSFYVANLNNEIVKVASEKEFLFALSNVGCKVSNILLEKDKIYVACDMANAVTIAIFDKSSKKFISKNFNNVYKISSFLPLGEGAFFTSFNGKAFLLDSKLNAKEQKSVGFAPVSACKFSDDEIFIGFKNGEILDLKSGAKKQVLRSKISALACAGDEVLVASDDGVIYKFDKSFKLKGKKELFSGEIKEIFIYKNVLVGVDLGNKTKSLEINSF